MHGCARAPQLSRSVRHIFEKRVWVQGAPLSFMFGAWVLTVLFIVTCPVVRAAGVLKASLGGASVSHPW